MPTTTTMSSRAQLKEWIAKRIAGEDEVILPDLVQECIVHFSKDSAFIQSLFKEALRELVYTYGMHVIKNSHSLIPVGEGGISREEITKRSRKHSVFANWLEHAGDRHVRLLEMTREQLLEAAQERRNRGNHEIRLAVLWETLAQQLEGGQRVSSKFTTEDIDVMAEQL